MVKLFVSGFPAEASELEIVQLFDPFGKVVTIKIVIDKMTKKRKGYAFLEMDEEAAAQTAILELNGAAWGDRELTVNYAAEKTASAKSIKNGYMNRQPATAVKKKRPRISR